MLKKSKKSEGLLKINLVTGKMSISGESPTNKTINILDAFERYQTQIYDGITFPRMTVNNNDHIRENKRGRLSDKSTVRYIIAGPAAEPGLLTDNDGK